MQVWLSQASKVRFLALGLAVTFWIAGCSSTASRSTTTAPAAGAPAAQTSPAPATGSTVQIKDDGKGGKLLADPQGKTLYTFDRDDKGVSNCSGSCAQTWPPLLITGPVTAPTGLSGNLESYPRGDGGQQVMYNDAPLYVYSADPQPGATNGDGVGGVWHIAHPA
jgi:predicted lipoprotein with Yx(FWY)xxD motif